MWKRMWLNADWYGFWNELAIAFEQKNWIDESRLVVSSPAAGEATTVGEKDQYEMVRI